MNFIVSDGKPEGKSEAMLVWAAHPDAEVDKRSKSFVITVLCQKFLCCVLNDLISGWLVL
jgi:hypothetical protein